MIDTRPIYDALKSIPDPEMPISIVDLGLIKDVRCNPSDMRPGATGGDVNVTVDVLPTFIGCPALDMIAGDIRAKLGAIPGVAAVRVNWLFDPPWSVDRITPEGRASLKEHGVTVPERGSKLPVPGHESQQTVTLSTSAIPCPFCDSKATNLESQFGPTRCRTIHYCNACKNSFEHLKRVGPRMNTNTQH